MPLLLAPLLSLLVLAAHFYRAGLWPLSLICLGAMVLLAVPRAWAARLVQVVLLLGALEWAWTTLDLVMQRIALGQPWIRLVFILGAVTLLSAAAGLVFRHPRLRSRYRLS